ncbi:MAG: hypothetical protein WDO12_10275 [Pseudomonadota bacterium]
MTNVDRRQFIAELRITRLQVKGHTMHKLVVTLSALVLAASAGAQEPFQCVNPDVLNSLVFDALPQLKLVARSSLPDVSDGLRAPAESR